MFKDKIKMRLSFVVLIVCGLSHTAFGKDISTTEDWERREILVDESSIDNIKYVVEDGRWTNDGFNGSLKFIVTAEDNGANKLFVQWVGDEDGEVAYTISIREFNSLPEFTLQAPSCINSDCTLSKVSAEHVYEGTPQVFTLNLVGLGRYSVGLFKQ